jgi:hypothetical protein
VLQKCRSISLFYRKTMLSEEGFEEQEEEQIIDSENRLRFVLVLVEISQHVMSFYEPDFDPPGSLPHSGQCCSTFSSWLISTGIKRSRFSLSIICSSYSSKPSSDNIVFL